MSDKKLKKRIARLEMQVARLERSVGDMDYIVQMADRTLAAADALRKAIGCGGGWPVDPREHFKLADTLIEAAGDDLQYYLDASKATAAITDGDTDDSDHADVQAGHDA